MLSCSERVRQSKNSVHGKVELNWDVHCHDPLPVRYSRSLSDSRGFLEFCKAEEVQGNSWSATQWLGRRGRVDEEGRSTPKQVRKIAEDRHSDCTGLIKTNQLVQD